MPAAGAPKELRLAILFGKLNALSNDLHSCVSPQILMKEIAIKVKLLSL